MQFLIGGSGWTWGRQVGLRSAVGRSLGVAVSAIRGKTGQGRKLNKTGDQDVRLESLRTAGNGLANSGPSSIFP
jgi:hypothetical protein